MKSIRESASGTLCSAGRQLRRGFTVVELLVATAVSMVLMLILTQAFSAGIDLFRTLRAQGQMMERLRTATTALRDDLASYHFSINTGTGSQTYVAPGNNYGYPLQYLSGQDLTYTSQNGPAFGPPHDGFFRLYQAEQNGIPATFDGTDSDGMVYSRATQHVLHFTVCRRETSPNVAANNPVDPSYLFSVAQIAPFAVTNGGQVPNPIFPRDFVDPPDFRLPNVGGTATFSTRWAEVAYFLVPNGNLTSVAPGANPNSSQLFNLYRRVKLVIPEAGTGSLPVPAGIVIPPANSETPKVSAGTTAPTPYDPAQVIRAYNSSGTNSIQVGNNPRTTILGPDITQPVCRMCMAPAGGPSVNYQTDAYSAGLISPLPPGQSPPQQPPFSTSPYYRQLAQDVAGNGNANIAAMAGDDIILSDVLSFEVKAVWDWSNDFTPQFAPLKSYIVPGLGTVPNTDYPFDYLPASSSSLNSAFQNLGLRVFDTWSQSQAPTGNPNPNPPWQYSIYAQPQTIGNPPNQQTVAGWQVQNQATSLPLPIRIKALQIRIRVWDSKSEQTRQLTIMMDM